MERRVSWSKTALKRVEDITYYLKEEWGNKVAEDFIEKLSKHITAVSKYPYIGAASDKKQGIRKILITKHNALFYKILKTKVHIADIFDTRQNPRKSKY
jgi:plasmid stabilization system protein ParE